MAFHLNGLGSSIYIEYTQPPKEHMLVASLAPGILLHCGGSIFVQTSGFRLFLIELGGGTQERSLWNEI
jgi:hypothetical protein